MDVILTILKDMWQGLLDFESGFIFAFLGVGTLLVAIITGLVGLIKDTINKP